MFFSISKTNLFTKSQFFPYSDRGRIVVFAKKISSAEENYLIFRENDWLSTNYYFGNKIMHFYAFLNIYQHSYENIFAQSILMVPLAQFEQWSIITNITFLAPALKSIDLRLDFDKTFWLLLWHFCNSHWLVTHSCLDIYLMNVVWTCHTFENIFGMKHQFANYWVVLWTTRF